VQDAKKKYKTWSNKEGKQVKKKQEQEICTFIRRFKSSECPEALVEDFQSSALQILCSRMRSENLGQGYIMISVPRTVYYSFIYPRLDATHFWSAHYGDWALARFRTRVISVCSTDTLHNVFGGRFVQPKEQPDLGGYNNDPKKGPLCGYLLFLNSTNTFTLSYNHTHQVLKFSFTYLTYRWCEVGTSRSLSLENGHDTEFGLMSPGFPVIGLRVRVWWKSWEESYNATVKRWSKKHKKWVLKYDLWEDKVLEDVPVIEWEFIE